MLKYYTYWSDMTVGHQYGHLRVAKRKKWPKFTFFEKWNSDWLWKNADYEKILIVITIFSGPEHSQLFWGQFKKKNFWIWPKAKPELAMWPKFWTAITFLFVDRFCKKLRFILVILMSTSAENLSKIGQNFAGQALMG